VNIKKALKFGSEKLKNSSTSVLDTEILLSFCLIKNKEWLFLNLDKKLNLKQVDLYKKLISRRKKKEPITYITNYKEFFGLDFYVDENVLIPRPETEILVEEALKFNKKKAKILDIGTGSGNIIISIGKNKKAGLYASDVSTQALKIARKNAQRHKVKVRFFKSNLFKNIPKISFDIVIANLPYLDPKWISEDLKYEPINALDGGKDGLEIIEKFLKQVKKCLTKNGVILFEIDPRQSFQLKKLTKIYLSNKNINLIKDLACLDRVVKIS